MADAKLTALTELTTPAGGDILYIVDDPGGTPLSRKVTVANIFGNAVRTSITPSANQVPLQVAGYSLTGSNASSLIDVAGTWNTTGTPTLIKANVTNTASNAASLLLDLQVGGTSQLSVARDGKLVLVNSQNYLTNSGGWLEISGSNGIYIFSTANAAFRTSGFSVSSSATISFTSGNAIGTADTILARDAANALALRNGTNAQTYRVYGTFTDSSNYVRAALSASTSSITLAGETAGTGADDIDVIFTPAGTGRVRFGTHSAVGAETVTGFITIKDSGGTERKLAVIS